MNLQNISAGKQIKEWKVRIGGKAKTGHKVTVSKHCPLCPQQMLQQPWTLDLLSYTLPRRWDYSLFRKVKQEPYLLFGQPLWAASYQEGVILMKKKINNFNSNHDAPILHSSPWFTPARLLAQDPMTTVTSLQHLNLFWKDSHAF